MLHHHRTTNSTDAFCSPWVRLFSKTVVLTRFYKTKCSSGIGGAVVVQHSCCLKVMLAALKKSITELKYQFAPFPIYHPCMFDGCFFHISTAKKHCGQTNLLKLSSPIVLCLWPNSVHLKSDMQNLELYTPALEWTHLNSWAQWFGKIY